MRLPRADTQADAAAHAMGLADFGEDSWREGLEVLVRSLDEEADLNDLGGRSSKVSSSATSRRASC